MNKRKILVVDDNPDNILIMNEIFEFNRPEYIVYQALNADNALTLAKKVIPDLIITDWDMPEKDGIELIKELKKNILTSEIPVIMATGVMLKSNDLKKALEAGAIDYIRKPIDATELLARTNSVLMLSDYHKQNIAIKNKELVENTMLLIKNNEFNIKFTKKLKELFNKLNTDNEEIVNIIDEILNQLDEKVSSDSWQRFELSFNELNLTFNNNLLSKFTDLTSAELKLCSFIKLGLSSKDIASILSQTSDSVKVARYRLRKKLNLDNEQNLQTFLAQF